MAQESDAQAFAFGGTFDDAWDVGHDEALVATIADNAEVRYQGGEGVVGNLRLGCRDDR